MNEWSPSALKEDNYKVYVHVFPDGKKYIGSTGQDVARRWQGGFRYETQELVFSAILKYGWNNIRHYILMDGLTKDEALLYEAAFIYSWKTYIRSRGYNTVLPKITEAKEINVPNFRDCAKIMVEDNKRNDIRDTYSHCIKSRRENSSKNARKRVVCVETRKICNSARAVLDDDNIDDIVDVTQIYRAISSGTTCGKLFGYDDLDKCSYMIYPHWEYTELYEKKGEHN